MTKSEPIPQILYQTEQNRLRPVSFQNRLRPVSFLLALRLFDTGVMLAVVHIGRYNSSGGAELVFSQDCIATINFDTEYTLSINYDGSKFVYNCAGETIEYNIATSIFPSNQKGMGLKSRIHLNWDEIGYIKTKFDDVRVE